MDSLDIWDKDKLALFIAFVIPGFISLKVFELLNSNSHRDSSKLLIDAIAFSCVNYALLFWAIVRVEANGISSSSPFLYSLFYIFVLFIAPVIWAIIWNAIRRSDALQKYTPHPIDKPWDHFFGQRKEYWVIATLRDGRQIAGLYSEKSFASSAPANEQLYLEEQWLLNKQGSFLRKVNDTGGVLITAHEILSVEFFIRT